MTRTVLLARLSVLMVRQVLYILVFFSNKEAQTEVTYFRLRKGEEFFVLARKLMGEKMGLRYEKGFACVVQCL